MSERSPNQRAEADEHPTPGGEVQLRLLTSPDARWRLDERTRTAGRQGVAEAREILRRVHPPAPVSRRRAS